MDPLGEEPPVPDVPYRTKLPAGTFRGCVGILLLLAMPLLLALPLERLGNVRVLVVAVPLVAFGLVAVGGWLMWTVPAGRSPARTRDPQHPLTRDGQAPVREIPATTANRRAAIVLLVLLAITLVGMMLAIASTPGTSTVFTGIYLTGTTGIALVVYGLLVIVGKLPAPAWRWLAARIGSERTRAGLAVLLIGSVPLVWALFFAAGNGAAWGIAGLAGVVLLASIATPLASRWPGRRG